MPAALVSPVTATFAPGPVGVMLSVAPVGRHRTGAEASVKAIRSLKSLERAVKSIQEYHA